jgi:hypothetical protein
MRKKKQSFELTFKQTEKLAKFSDASLDHPKLSFEEVVRQKFGPKRFPHTPQGRLFEKECREIFDRERE